LLDNYKFGKQNNEEVEIKGNGFLVKAFCGAKIREEA